MSRKVRIALVTQAMRMGGVETYLLRLGRYLQGAGCEVEIVTAAQRGEWFDRIAEWDIPARAITKHRWANPLLHTINVGRRLAHERYDVIFLNHAKFAQRAIGFLPDSTIVIPVLHNDLENIYHVGLAHPGAWNAAVAVSDRVYELAHDREPDRPIIQIPYGVQMPETAAWQARRGFKRPLRLLFVGRLAHAHKGVKFLPQILHACTLRGLDVSLTIAGDGEDREVVLQEIAHYGMQDRTRYLGAVPPERVYELLLDSHVLLLPSFYEGLPIILLEAQACGCVPVASRLEGISDQAVADGKTGSLVAVGQIAGFVEAIATLYENPALWQQWSRSAHQRIADGFSVEVMGRAYRELIDDARAGRYPLPQSRKHIRLKALAQKL